MMLSRMSALAMEFSRLSVASGGGGRSESARDASGAALP